MSSNKKNTGQKIKRYRMNTVQMEELKRRSAVKWKRRLKVIGLIFMILFLVMVGLYYFVQSATFENWVRTRVIDSLSEITGRKVLLRKVDIDLPEFAVTLNDLIIEGLPEEKTPFFRVNRIHSRLSPFNLFKRELKFRYVDFIKPEIYIKVDENGKLNIPTLHIERNRESPFFSTVISHLNLREGLFYVNNRVAAASAEISDFHTGIRYDPENDSYEGRIKFSRGSGQVGTYDNLSLSLDSTFIFLPDRLIFPELKVKFSGADILSSGVLYDFQNPKYSFDYRGTYDLRLLTEIFHLPVRLEGIASLEGVVRSSLDKFRAEGQLSIPQTHIGPFSLKEVSSHYLLSPEGVTFTEINLQAFGGEVKGSFLLDRGAQRTSYLLNMESSDVKTDVLLGELKFGELGIESETDMKLNLHWDNDGPHTLGGSVNLNMRKNKNVSDAFLLSLRNLRNNAGFRPVGKDTALTLPVSAEGSVDFKIKDGEWNLRTSRINLPATKFIFYGNGYLFDKFEQEVKIESGEIKEMDLLILRLVRVLRGWHGDERDYIKGQLPPPFVGIRGAAQFRGRLEYEKGTPLKIYGNVFGKRVWAHNVFWDEGGAFLEYRENKLSFNKGWSRKGSAESKFTGFVYILGVPPEGEDLLDLKLELKNMASEDVQDLFFRPKDLSGAGTGKVEVRIAGSGDATGLVDVSIRNGVLFKDTFDRGIVKLDFDSKWLRFSKIHLMKGNQSIETSLDFNLEEAAFRCKGSAHGLKIDELKSLYLDRSPVSGIADLDFEGKGFLWAPELSVNGKMRKFTFLGKSFGDGSIDITGGDGNMSLRAFFEQDATSLSADMRLSPEYTFQIDAELEDANLYNFIPRTRGIVDDVIDGSFSGKFHMSGSFFELEKVFVEGEVTSFALMINSYLLQNSSSIKFTIKDYTVSVPDLVLGDGQGNIKASGVIGLSRLVPTNMKFKIDLNLEELVNVFSDLALRGHFRGEGYLRGFVLDPYWGGKGNISDGYFMFLKFPVPLENLAGELSFTQHSFVLSSIKGKSGRGDVNIDGQMTFKNSRPDQVLFRMNGEQVRVEYPTGVEYTLGGTLTLSGNWNNKEVSGSVSISKLKYLRRFDLEKQLTTFAARGTASYNGARKEGFWKTAKLNVSVSADDNILIDNNIAQAELAADLRLTGPATNPVILGRVEFLHGQIYYRDRTFQIISASIDNVDPYKLNPVIDFNARTKVKNYLIYLSMRGTKEQLYPTLTSEPSLPTIDIINLLALGKPRETIYQRSEEALLGVGLSSFFSKQLVGGLEEGAEKLFGFDRFRIDPFLVGSKANPTARLTVGKRITKDLTLVYSTNISENQEDVLILEYRLSDNILLVASRNEFRAYGIDIQFESKF